MRKLLGNKYVYRYPHPAVTTDCVVFGFDGTELQILLIQRGCAPQVGSWALPGGFLQMDETLEEGAKRELKEETALEPTVIEQFHAFSAVNRDPRERVITVAFIALVRSAAVKGGDDAADARWFSIEALPPLAFDHAEIIAQARHYLRERIRTAPIGFDLLDEQFTIPQLQRIYELILGTTFDRRNFYRKITQSNLVQPAPQGPSHSTDLQHIESSSPQSDLRAPAQEIAQAKPDASSASLSVGRKPGLFTFVKEKYLKLKKEEEEKLDL